jgi:hypothetical protein
MDRIARLDARRDDDEVDSSCSLRWFLRRFIPLAPYAFASLRTSASSLSLGSVGQAGLTGVTILIAAASKHADWPSTICGGRFKSSSYVAHFVEGVVRPVFCEIGFRYLRRNHCHVERSASRIEWLGDPLVTR